ncbi:MAG TPA: pentapeptide repeat-containing protein [Treponema sp.]|nr:pentapeptide repeat-containing protein [Treponema sp.]
MFKKNLCMHLGCKKLALSQIDDDGNITDEPGYCIEHLENPSESVNKIRNYLLTHDKIINLNIESLSISGVDLSNKFFCGCSIQNCTFANMHASNLRLRMSVFNFCTFTDSTFLQSNFQFCSFAGAKFINTLFTGSDLLNNNFNGTTAYQCSFDDSDLYNSQFIKAILMNTSMKNCNLKKTIFYDSLREAVSFKLSNTREALFDRIKNSKVPLHDESEDEAEA